jgi:hypothetical protein
MGRHQGMADAGRDEVRTRVLAAWDAFITEAERVDLSRRSRLPGWRAHEICVHLGSWDDHRAMADLVDSARTGATGTQPDPDAVNARVTAAHAAASREEVLDALRRNRAATERYLAEEPVELDTAPTVSVVGRVPLLSVVLGQAYEHPVPGGTHEGPAVEASAELLLEAASGRVNPVPAVARRQLRVHEVSGLLALAPIVQKVPGIPGGPILQLAARTMGGAGGVLGRLFRKG